MEGAATLATQGLYKFYGRRKVVDDVSIEVRQGEIVGLLGPNGAGKTTTFYMVVGFIKPNDGHVYLNDQEITSLPMYKRARRGIGYLPQEPSVFRKLSVDEFALTSRRWHDSCDCAAGEPGLSGWAPCGKA
jgi:lipopolysaccharide export system ATP-binding protein